MMVPVEERARFYTLLRGHAEGFGMGLEEYLKKVWYHEQASRIGEYMALVLVDQLLQVSRDVPMDAPASAV